MRATASPEETDFLYRESGERLAERLDAINRQFTSVLDIGGHAAPYLPVAEDAEVTSLEAVWSSDSEILPVEEASFDLVVANLTLQSVNDLPGLLIQINHALKPDGLLLATLLGGETLTELRDSFLAGESRVTGRAYPRIAPMADVRDLGNLIQRAGLALPVADSERVTVTYGSLLPLMQDLRGLGLQNTHSGRSRSFMRRDVLMAAGEHYHQQHSNAAGRLLASFDLITLTGWHPHESQQKPLKPGSGKVSMVEALNRARGDSGN